MRPLEQDQIDFLLKEAENHLFVWKGMDPNNWTSIEYEVIKKILTAAKEKSNEIIQT